MPSSPSPLQSWGEGQGEVAHLATRCPMVGVHALACPIRPSLPSLESLFGNYEGCRKLQSEGRRPSVQNIAAMQIRNPPAENAIPIP